MASCSPQPRSAVRPKFDTSRIPKIALSVRCGVGGVRGMRYAQACKRIGVVMSTGKSLRKPRDDPIERGIDILAIELCLEIGRADHGSRIQEKVPLIVRHQRAARHRGSDALPCANPSNSAWQREPPGTDSCGFGRSSLATKVALAASITRSTNLTVAT